MNITLLNINHSTKTAKNGKAYQIAEVAYKNNTYGGKVEGFKVTSYMKGYADVTAASIGDTLDVVVEKGNGGFNEWVAANKAIPGVTPPMQNKPVGTQTSAASSGYATAPKAAQPFGRDFESREERAKKQVYIVRQSAISSAIAALSLGAKSALKANDVIDYAKQLEAFVFETQHGFEDVPNLDPDFNTDPEPQI